jgi:AcrR family transcriptional regulator
MDRVAERAAVARMTLYHQFESKAQLLEAVFDFVASRGQLQGLSAAAAQADPLEGLEALIAMFGNFWSSDRLVMRHLRGLATLDPELGAAVQQRNDRRKDVLRVLIARVHDVYGRPPKRSFENLVALLHTLTNFETYDTLAGASRTPAEVSPLIARAAVATLGFQVRTSGPASRRRPSARERPTSGRKPVR